MQGFFDSSQTNKRVLVMEEKVHLLHSGDRRSYFLAFFFGGGGHQNNNRAKLRFKN